MAERKFSYIMWKIVAESNLLLGLQDSQYPWYLPGKATHTCTRHDSQTPGGSKHFLTRGFFRLGIEEACGFTFLLTFQKQFTPSLCTSSNGVRWKISQRYGYILLAEGCERLPSRYDHTVTQFVEDRSWKQPSSWPSRVTISLAFTGKSHTHTNQTW